MTLAFRSLFLPTKLQVKRLDFLVYTFSFNIYLNTQLPAPSNTQTTMGLSDLGT